MFQILAAAALAVPMLAVAIMQIMILRALSKPGPRKGVDPWQ